MDELTKAYNRNVTQGTPSTATDTAAPANQDNNMISNNASPQAQAINQMYEAQAAQKQAELQATYEQNRSAQQAEADKIPQTYADRANDLATQYERNRRNLNLQAAGNGINTGTGSQQALALNQQYQQNYGTIQKAQADAQTEANRALVDLETQYKLNVQSALAKNDYQKAAALVDEYNNGYQRDLTRAKALADYGDFSGYENLYGKDQADNMAAVWKFTNPDLAWNLGKITGEEYKQATGQYPEGYTPAGSGGYGGDDGGYSWEYASSGQFGMDMNGNRYTPPPTDETGTSTDMSVKDAAQQGYTDLITKGYSAEDARRIVNSALVETPSVSAAEARSAYITSPTRR